MTTWNDRARIAMDTQLVASGEPFTADDLRDLVGEPDTHHAANGRNNAIGTIFRDYKRAGLIEEVGHTKSRSPERKGGLICIWRGATHPPATDQMDLFTNL